jgi:ABC-type amino acid transport substrate-binding protein
MQRLPFTFASFVMLLVSLLSSSAQGADTLKIAVAPWYFPVIFEADGGKIQGIDADLVQLIAEKTGMKVEFRVMPRESIGAAVANGEADLGLSAIESRSYLRDYNVTSFDHGKISLVDYYEVPAHFVVRKEEIKDVTGLKGRFVASLAYTTSRITLSEWQSAGLVGKVFGFENEKVLVNTFKLNRVQSVLVSLPAAHELTANSGGAWRSFAATVNGKAIREPIGLILPVDPADAARGKKIAQAIEAVRSSGKIAEIAAKWIDNP